jgi:hypothetical protein
MACRRSGVRIPLAPQVLRSSRFGEVYLHVVVVIEGVIHDRRSTADRGHDHVPVDSLGDVGGLVAHGVADLLDWHPIGAHDRHCRVSALVGVPVSDARLPGHLGEAPVERVGRVGVAVLLAEDKVIVAPGFAGFSALSILPGLVRLECHDGAFRQDERTPRLGGLGVAALAHRAPDVDHSPTQVYVVPGELAQLAGAQAKRDGQDEERFESQVDVVGLI